MRGGKRPGGGRPKGRKDGPNCLRQTRKREYRELYETEAIRILAGLRAGQEVREPHRRRAVRKLIRMQIDFARRLGDSRTLHDMIDRIVGKVPQPLEHGGEGGGPVILEHRILYVDSENSEH